MIRRQARLRREYLYKKSLETQERQTFEKKQKLKEALREGRPIPTELQNEAEELNKALKLDEAQADAEATQDDEYARAGIYDPKVVVTTSRDPSSRLQQFAKELRLVIPNSQRINRGNYVVSEVVETCKANQVTDLVVVHETRGQPDGLIVSHLPYGPTVHFTLYNVVLRHDIENRGNISEAYPHLIFENFSSRLGGRIKSVLRYLFPVPKQDTKRVLTFANDSDFISFRHHVYAKSAHNEVQLAEVGPRFEMRPYEIRLGTVDMPDADKEWALRTYQRTARKRNVL
ncbi:Brix-domain-containing protein [Coemansia reversa NRRL 1564]|uniref:U3 small nucleolar ribonucleoprotein protein IMP4 n=1 Tax=Coemansia reversa (strain ATCC 12441 / NRRL 1564) TaxID=763665 RepID=A0A2G5B351_COERN|nr:Brix-domain-containing protein [Coemansia reversa NRRL 1564]|eukprot:PIA13448.1 Brix-domain-containing protein [Coemansia reversa NRRL 1564]